MSSTNVCHSLDRISVVFVATLDCNSYYMPIFVGKFAISVNSTFVSNFRPTICDCEISDNPDDSYKTFFWWGFVQNNEIFIY